MHKFTGRIVATVGVDRAAADKAVGIILPYRHRHDAVENAVAGVERLRGARAALRRSQITSSVGSAAVGIGNTAGTDAIQALRRSAISYASQMARAHAVGDIAGAVPGCFV